MSSSQTDGLGDGVKWDLPTINNTSSSSNYGYSRKSEPIRPADPQFWFVCEHPC